MAETKPEKPEHAPHTSEAEMFRLLVESVRDYAIFMLDPQGRVMSWNPGAERVKQYRADEIIGKHFSIFFPPEDVAAGKPQREIAAALEAGRFEDEAWRIRKDGSRFWANVVLTAVYDSTHTLRGFAKVTRDITARREAEETRRALLEQREARLKAEEDRRRAESSFRVAQEANRAKDEFLMTLSHELRTPMTAILGWARMLPNMHAGDPTFVDAVAAIGRSAQLQARLIDDVLDVSRIVSGKMRLNVESVDIVPVLQAALDSVRSSAEARRITLATSFEPNLGTVTVDPTRLQQMVWNLLSNAVKFTPKGGRVELSATRTSSQLHICVDDTGEGVDPQFLPHVFEPFRQAETSSTRAHGGLGLGLSIVRYLAEAHGGMVTAESEGRGRGARFTITLPIRAVRLAESGKTAPGDTATPQLTSLGGRKILLVDDDRESRELIAAVLRQAGAKVMAVDSAAGALDYAEHQRPDIVITDIAMPEMDGYALQRQLRQRDTLTGTPIIALTAFPASAVSADEKAFDLYLRKPIDPFELTETLSRMLA